MERLVELGLRAAQSHDPEGPEWEPFAQSLLQAILELPTEGADEETCALQRALVRVRRHLLAATHPQERRRAAADCLAASTRFLRRLDHDRGARDAELSDLIAVLREAAVRLLGDSSRFHESLHASANRLGSISRLDDLRELKRKLVGEVAMLEQLVAAKEQRDRDTIAELSRRVELLQADLANAEAAASIDPLTRVANRGAFDRTLPRMIEAARTAGWPLTLAMIDIDHFKAINDAHGHQIGDRVLRCAADWLSRSVRQSDVVVRYGGEEFAVILPDADLTQSSRRFTQVLSEIAAQRFEYDAETGASLRFTLSCGIAQLAPDDRDHGLVSRADQALYDAKRAGRNRVATRKTSLLHRLTGYSRA